MLRAAYCRYTLRFGFTAVTSRERMNTKETYYIKLWHSGSPGRFGLGECALFRGLGADDTPDYERRLASLCAAVNRDDIPAALPRESSIAFGYETALSDLSRGGCREPFGAMPSDPASGIRINGLVWMGTIAEMERRAAEKIDAGFRCLKFKIGGQDFGEEVELLRRVRSQWSVDKLEIRLDANGAFSPAEALSRLRTLSQFGIHSIEQPIRSGQRDEMARICRESPIPVALDEELIGCSDPIAMLSAIRPRYIVLKPSLCGGFARADAWIAMARSLGIGWWATSALESDIGLNAIARWVSVYAPSMPQGLGTGGLYTNNFISPLRLDSDRLYSAPGAGWKYPGLQWIQPD